MENHIIEGTWEEVLTLTPELSGHRVRVTILDDDYADHQTGDSQNLAQVLQGRLGRLSFDVPDFSQKAGDIFTDILVEKHKRLTQ
ncbi:MAG: hypothetical protein RLZZ148_2824 [Cyanobacteriota bacterium]